MSLTAAPDLLSIGDFARRSRLSHKALRAYAELGLLAPAWVNEGTGYRFYRADQLGRARLIGLLRRLDMPLARIGRVLEMPGPDAAREVARFWSEVEAEATVKRRLVAHLERHLEGRGEPMYSVRHRLPDPLRLLAYRSTWSSASSTTKSWACTMCDPARGSSSATSAFRSGGPHRPAAAVRRSVTRG